MKYVKWFAVLIITSNMLWAIYSVRLQDGSNWDLMLSNFGKFGSAWWPENSNHNYVFGAGFNIGGIKPNSDTSVTEGYCPHNAAFEYVPGITSSNPADPRWHVYFSYDIDFPLSQVTSMQDGYAVYNDFDPDQHIPDTGIVLGISVTQYTYTFPIGWAHDMVFFKYIVKNETTYTINDVYLGVVMDFDIGNEAGGNANDRCDIDLTRKLFYGWQEALEPGTPPWRPGMLGYKLLSPYVLSSYKRYAFTYEPFLNRELYLTMAGYNYQNGQYEPYDTIIPDPDDQRISINSGPFSSLAPGDSIIIDWVLIASNDTIPPCPEMLYRADKAQACYDIGWHNVQVMSPNGGEVISGNYTIDYSAISVTPNPLLIDLYLLSENGLDTIILGQSNNGNYNWNTVLWPDGVFYKILAIAYDTITFGADISDNTFTINNPGNSPPVIMFIDPAPGETLFSYYDIKWFARDPEFQDSLSINIYFKSVYDSMFQPIAIGEINDSIYTWNTIPFRNGSGFLAIQTSDESFTVADTVQVHLLNQLYGGPIQHTNGLNNVVNLKILIHDTLQITGHTYQLEFLQYKRLPDYPNYPEYFYRITDTSNHTIIIDNYSLGAGYTNPGEISDFSPIVDGFSIWSYTTESNVISQGNFRYDSVKVILGNYPEESLTTSSSSKFWAYRGSRLQLNWTYHTNGGLTLFVTDLDYSDTIPYKPWNRVNLNPDSAFGWCFTPVNPGAPPSDTLRPGYDRYLMLCGGFIVMSVAVIPDTSDCWIVDRLTENFS